MRVPNELDPKKELSKEAYNLALTYSNMEVGAHHYGFCHWITKNHQAA